MKVLTISHLYPSSTNPVLGNYVADQVRALRSLGCDNRVVAPVPWVPQVVRMISGRYRALRQVPLYAVRDGMDVFYPRYFVLPRNLLFAHSPRWVRWSVEPVLRELVAKDRPDLIHAHFAVPAAAAVLPVARHLGIPLVVTIHGNDLLEEVAMHPGYRRHVHQVFQESEAVIFVSSQLERMAFHLYPVVTGRSHVISNGFRDDLVAASRDEALYADLTICCVGHLVNTKGQDDLIRALPQVIKAFPTLKVRIVGDGPERERLQARVAQLGLIGAVQFTGRLEHPEAIREMARCHLFVLPSWREGFGIVYLEAMALGKPVIACEGQGIADVLQPGMNGLLVPGCNSEALAAVIIKLLAKKEWAREMGERARILAWNKYSWTKNAEHTLQLYKQVLGR